jgi:pSer/pThr/pTyr-binding forkhead associated (FHA) protein
LRENLTTNKLDQIINSTAEWTCEYGHYSLGYIIDTVSGGKFPLRGFRFSIGRDSSNDIEVKDESVSRHHALIVCKDSRYFLEDLGSNNGTLLNGKIVIRQERLLTGDTIKLGHTVFCFSMDRVLQRA